VHNSVVDVAFVSIAIQLIPNEHHPMSFELIRLGFEVTLSFIEEVHDLFIDSEAVNDLATALLGGHWVPHSIFEWNSLTVALLK